MSLGPRVPIVQVDAFTDVAFAGNPAAVCILDTPRDEGWMQQVAAENNLAETAYLAKQDDGHSLRWFTPAIEVDLCGHATLASAHVLWETGRLQTHEQARFHTKSGLLTANRNGDWIELDFPSKPDQKADPPAQLMEALGIRSSVHIGRNQFDYLVELESEEELRAVRPNHVLLRQLPVRGVIVTSRSRDYDCVSRFFAPGSGIDEDPVTGSAHCALAPYWGEKLGKTELRAFQASPRGGFLRLRLKDDRVILGGQAVTVLIGELLV